MNKILVIAPYQGLQELFQEVIAERQMNNMDVLYGDLFQGVNLAKSLEKSGYDVIISRGATARLLRKHCTVPVVDVRISGYDVFRTISLVKDFKGKIGMMSYFNVIEGAESIGRLLDIDFSYYIIEEGQDIVERMKEAIADGVDVMIGDSAGAVTAERLGMRSILITSGKEAVVEAISEAEQIAFYTTKERRKVKLLTAAFNEIEEGMIIVDENGSCQQMNSFTGEMLGIDQTLLKNEPITNIHPYLSLQHVLANGKKEQEMHVQLNQQQFTIEKIPIMGNQQVLGGIAKLKREKNNAAVRLQDTVEKGIAYCRFSQLVCESKQMKELIASSKRIASTEMPVLIYGKPGTEKNMLAEAIHNSSTRSGESYYYFNCEDYTSDVIDNELFGIEGDGARSGLLEIANGGTVHLGSIDRLPFHIQGRILEFIEKGQLTRLYGNELRKVNVRMIGSTEQRLEFGLENSGFSRELFQSFQKAYIQVPSLAERPEDMKELIRWFIASTNAKIGKQIVGLSPKVDAFLKAYPWPGNVKQLKTTIEQLCYLSKGPFIEEEEVQYVLLRLKNEEKKAGNFTINIQNKTLKQLETEIIQRLMEEDDFNQTEVAKKLGINRTTLWRKLKQ